MNVSNRPSPFKKGLRFNYLTNGTKALFDEAFAKISESENFGELFDKHLKSINDKKTKDMATDLEMALFNTFYNLSSKKYRGKNLAYHLKRANIESTQDLVNASAEYIIYSIKKNKKLIS